MGEEERKDFDYKVKKIAKVAVISACILVAFYFAIYRISGLTNWFGKVWSVFQPIIMGFILAFLMNPIMKFFEHHLYKWFKKITKTEQTAFTVTRTISSILALLVIVGLVVFIIYAVVPELIDTITYLVNHIEEQIAGVLDWANEITKGKYEESIMNAKENKIDTAIETAISYVEQYLNVDQDEMISFVTTYVISIGRLVVNIIIAMFVSVYVLISKETFKGQTKKIIVGLLKGEHANIVMEVLRKSGDIFYGFIIGKIVDSIIIGIICYISCLIMSMPYALLVSVIIGVTNVIPVFGPYIGAVPTVIIIFLTEPMQGIYFLIFVLILQQFDGNWLGPKILGNSTGISSFWVVFAVVVGGGLFGVPGMIIGVPVMAIIYYLLSRHSKYLLNKKGLPGDTNEYVRLKYIDVEKNELVVRTEEEEANKRIELFSRTGFKKKKK